MTKTENAIKIGTRMIWFGLGGLLVGIIGFFAIGFSSSLPEFFGFLWRVTWFLMPLGLIVALLGVSVILATLIASIAEKKGRNWESFFWLSILFSPLIMWIVAASISPTVQAGGFSQQNEESLQPAANDLAKEIEKLGELKDKGLITQAEFDSKKKELLDRI